jgi:uncharacterized protein
MATCDSGEVHSDDAVFASPSGDWTPVSPKLAAARRLTLIFGYGPVIIGGVLVALSPLARIWSVVYAVIALIVFVWAWWLIGRRVASYGYAERKDDLLVVSGILVKRLVIVPYGRMQMVDLRSGPIDRWLGVSTVQLHTAAATTDAAIPGLPPADAASLRDRLAAKGEARSAGL